MKILCIVSHYAGHLDFGGMGYVKLASALVDRGHDVVWLSPPRHCGFLSGKGFRVVREAGVESLILFPYFSIIDIACDRVLYQKRLEVLRTLSASFSRIKPDLILIDRILPFGAMIAERLGIPYAAIGTSGQYWYRKHDGMCVSPKPVAAYQGVGERFRQDLGWPDGGLSSAWINSGYANISFIGKGFYNKAIEDSPRAWHIHHFDDNDRLEDRCRLGASFGNTGAVERMAGVIECLRKSTACAMPLDIFIGNRTDIPELSRRSAAGPVEIHGWVDFSEYFPSLGCLAFFGGIGTVWSCLNHYVPMLVVAGGVGDQRLNGEGVARLGIGEYLWTDRLDCASVTAAAGRLVSDGNYLGNIRRYRSRENYTDTMETAVDKLERL